MLKILKQCPVCDKEFEYSNRKYCSDECSAESIREKDKIRKRKKREADQQARLEKAIKRIEERQANSNELEERERRQRDLKARGDKGNYLAKMTLAKPFSYEYWNAYRDYEIENSKQFESTFIRYVNGISVYDDDFAEKVMFTIDEQEVIRSELIRV